MKNAKRILALLSTLLLLLTLTLTLASCGEQIDHVGLWENATYRSDKTFGNGENTFSVTVKVEEQSVTFTINTDKTIVGEALLEHELIAGDMEDYGLYVKYVNGIRADYDIDKAYWAFYIDGEYALTGVDNTPIEEGKNYELIYSK